MNMELTCFSTAPGPTTRAAAMAALDRPSAISASTSRSRAVSGVKGSPRAGEQLGHHLGVDGAAALGHPLQGVNEVGHVGDAVLQQVPDPAAALTESSSAA